MKQRPSFALCALLLALLALGASAAEPGRLTVTWLDMAAHGLAVVVETPSGKVFLIDAGGSKSATKASEGDYNAGRDTIAPFLKARGHNAITGLAISHPHGDHYGGAMWLLANWQVGELIDNGYEGRGQTPVYRELRTAAVERGGRYRAIVAGGRLDWDPALSVEVLSPPAEFLSTKADPAKISEHGLLNGNSLLLRVQHGKNVFLFPGDSYGGAFEQHLKATVVPERLRATVLTAPHHGFNPGTNFPKMVSPQIVVVSALGDYPANATTPYPRSPGTHATKIFGALGAKVFVTAWHGNVQIVSDGETVKAGGQRESEPWPEPPKPSQLTPASPPAPVVK